MSSLLVLVLIVCFNSCSLLDGIGVMPQLTGSVSLSPSPAIAAGSIAKIDISHIDYNIKPNLYSWYYSDTDTGDITDGSWNLIPEAKEQAYEVPYSYIGKYISAQVSDSEFNGSLSTEAIVVQDGIVRILSGYLTILYRDSENYSNMLAGEKLTLDTSGLNADSDSPPPEYTYEWTQSTDDITFGATPISTTNEYTLAETDYKTYIQVKISADGYAGYVSAKLYISPVTKINLTGNAIILYDGSPTYSIMEIGKALSADTGDLNSDDAVPPPRYTFEWTRASGGGRDFDTPLKANADNSYTLVEDDKACYIQLKVTAAGYTGAIYAETFVLTGDIAGNYISGLVSIDQLGDTFAADTSAVLYGTAGASYTPSYTWSVDNAGDRNFTQVQGPLDAAHNGDVLNLQSKWNGCNIQVMITASPLSGAVYADKLYDRSSGGGTINSMNLNWVMINEPAANAMPVPALSQVDIISWYTTNYGRLPADWSPTPNVEPDALSIEDTVSSEQYNMKMTWSAVDHTFPSNFNFLVDTGKVCFDIKTRYKAVITIKPKAKWVLPEMKADTFSYTGVVSTYTQVSGLSDLDTLPDTTGGIYTTPAQAGAASATITIIFPRTGA
jgi:hypothetical protein